MSIKKRLDDLSAHRQRLKHGRHDQRKHGIWAEGIGGSRDGITPSRGGGGAIAGGTQGLAQNVIANSRRTQTAQRLRPERRADNPIRQRFVRNAIQRRNASIENQRDYRRRHRMTKATAPLQGSVIPSEMLAVDYGDFVVDDATANLFRNPALITAKDSRGKKINLWDTFNDYMTAHIEHMSERMKAQGYSDDAIEQITSDYADASMRRLEGVLRKGAASFAMDVQGFVGGQIYGNNDPEYQASLALAMSGNDMMQRAETTMSSLRKTISKTPEYKNADKSFQIMMDTMLDANEVDYIINDFGAAQRDASRVTERRMASQNPSLVADILERRLESAMKPNVDEQATGNVFDVSVRDILSENIALTSTNAITTPLRSLLPLLHPNIRRQLESVVKSKKVKYPSAENPADALRISDEREISNVAKNGADAMRHMVDSMHTDGGIADVKLVEREGKDQRVLGEFLALRQGFGVNRVRDDSVPVMLHDANSISANEFVHPETATALSMTHEFAHAIDVSALVFGERYWRDNVSLFNEIGKVGALPPDMSSKLAMVPPVLRIIERWMNRVAPTARTRASEIDRENNSLENRQFYSYLEQPAEIFARAYEQWVGREMIRRIEQGDNIPGLTLATDDDRQRAIETIRSKHGNTGNRVPSYFDDADMDAVSADIAKLFSVMGWKLK